MVGGSFTINDIETETLGSIPPSETCTDGLYRPCPLGVHERFEVSALEQPVGSPDQTYESPAIGPNATTVSRVLSLTSSAAGAAAPRVATIVLAPIAHVSSSAAVA